MIDTILLENFQAHEKTLLELDKGVNVIVGESDAGKSAILRAIYWTLFGRPSGDSIIRQGAKEPCRVKIKTSDGHEVVRVKGCGKNQYEVDGEVYKAFNKSVPEDVTSVLNMDRLNFSLQLDPPFLFSMSGGEVAQYMNKLVDLEIVTSSLSRVNQMVRKAEDNSRNLEASIEEKEAALSKMAWVDEAKKAVEKMEAKDRKCFKLKKSYAMLKLELERLEEAEQKVQSLSHVEEADKALSRILAKRRTRDKLANAVSVLDNAVYWALDARDKHGMLAWVDKAESSVLRLAKKRDALLKKNASLDILKRAVQKYSDCVLILDRAASNYSKNRLRYKQEFPNVCPLCGQRVDKEKL